MSCRIIQQQNHRSMIFCSSDRFQDAFSSSFLDYFLECEPGSGPPSTVAIVSSPSAFFRITSVFSTCSDPKIYFILFFFLHFFTMLIRFHLKRFEKLLQLEMTNFWRPIRILDQNHAKFRVEICWNGWEKLFTFSYAKSISFNKIRKMTLTWNDKIFETESGPRNGARSWDRNGTLMGTKNCPNFPILNRFHLMRFEKWSQLEMINFWRPIQVLDQNRL